MAEVPHGQGTSVFADAEHWTGPAFRLGSASHLGILTVVVLFQVLVLDRFGDADEHTKRRVRLLLVTALWGQELAYHGWRLATRTWSAREMLPLHLCSVAVWLCGLTLLTRNQRLYEHSYFLALTGAAMGLATPDIGRFGFPHFRFFQFFASHGLILTAPLWMTLAEGRRPGPGALRRAILTTSAHAAGAYLVNRRLGSNYMFVNRKPSTRSALDRLPAWPGYVPIMGAAVAGLFALWYVPFARRS